MTKCREGKRRRTELIDMTRESRDPLDIGVMLSSGGGKPDDVDGFDPGSLCPSYKVSDQFHFPVRLLLHKLTLSENGIRGLWSCRPYSPSGFSSTRGGGGAM